MKKVVIVSYNFPPVGGAGVQRPVKFVKYLRRYGWEPVVLTVANPSVPVFDHGLLRDIPPGVAVHGARSFEPSYARKREFDSSGATFVSRVKQAVKRVAANFLLPDLQVLWWPGLVIGLVRVMMSHRPKIIFVSAPPFSSFLPVVFLGRMMRVPVVLDYRDEWSFSREHWENSTKHGMASRLDSLMERYAVSRCAAFTAANRSYVSAISANYAGAATGKGFVVTNGFDEDDFAPRPKHLAPSDRGKIKIVYAGTVWKATSLASFLAALRQLMANDTAMREVLSVRIFGRVVDAELPHLEDEGVAGVVQRHGYLPHTELMGEIWNADVLLLTLSDLPGAGKIITGKAFEYMASGKQILALVPEGETRDLLATNYNKLSVVPAEDLDGIRRALRQIVAEIGNIRMTPGNDVSHFSRKALAGELAAVFDKVVGQ